MLPTSRDIIHTIRLAPADRRRLVSAMEKIAAQSPWSHEKRQLRFAYPGEELAMHVQHEGGDQSHAAISRNLSRWGIAVLIGRFMYPDSEVTLDLRRLNGQTQTVRGRVLRCRHVSRMVHEVSALFDEPIEVGRFVELTADEQRRLDLERAGTTGGGTEDDEPVLSHFTAGGPLQPVLESLVRNAARFADELRLSLGRSDLELLESLTRQLAGLGDGCGFGPLGEAARVLLDHLAMNAAKPTDVTAATDGVLDVLRRLRCEVGDVPPVRQRPG